MNRCCGNCVWRGRRYGAGEFRWCRVHLFKRRAQPFWSDVRPATKGEAFVLVHDTAHGADCQEHRAT